MPRRSTPRLVPLVLVLVAIIVSTNLTGCGPVETAGSSPRDAKESGRRVIASTVESQSARIAPPAGPSVPDPIEHDLGETSPQEPVVATRPQENDSTTTAPGTAEIVEPSASAPDLSLDPSRFPGGIIPASPNAKPLPGGPRLLVPHKTFRTEGRSGTLRINYDDLDLLKILNMDPVPSDVVDHFPQWLRDLDGKTVRLRGFMYTSYQEEMPAFVLTRDTGECCFGPNPKVYYLIAVKMKEGTTARYVQNRPVDVTGTFHIAPVYLDGTWAQLYRITDAEVAD